MIRPWLYLELIDGETLALDSSGSYDIFAVNVKTGALKRLTQGQGSNTSPSWAPNGRQIAFTSTRSGSPQLYLMDADGSNQTPLVTAAGGDFQAVWSPGSDFSSFARLK